MKPRDVVFAPQAEADLLWIYDTIAETIYQPTLEYEASLILEHPRYRSRARTISAYAGLAMRDH